MAALELFRYQYANNALYRSYCDLLRVNLEIVQDVCQVPFLPISFFKSQPIVSSPAAADTAVLVFESSGTTGEVPSRHYVHNAKIYEDCLLSGFREFYGSPADYTILALLPSYLERGNASLVYMARTLMAAGAGAESGFYINEWDKLATILRRNEATGQKTLLLGVTYALLDFAESHPMDLRHTIVMETGGMKGRRVEMTRDEVHAILKQQWQLPVVHSEYGMTELLSQAYSDGEGIFRCSATMQVLVRDINDPLDVRRQGGGAVNVVDLANVHSCAFIATEDMGVVNEDGTFKVMGRLDHSALRGCSLMAV
ncbi:MAG: acyl transferase [Flavipsychrobacter sp.]|nr:acyl transferase [Flavipsychrobacter sp.]